MEPYTHIVWDFNGTLLDDLAPSLGAANDLLRLHNLPILPSLDAYREVFGFPIIDYYRRLGFDFEQTPYDALAVEWVALYRRHAESAGLFPHVQQLLRAFRKRGLRQWILSATHKEMLEEQLRGLGICDCFDGLLALDNIHAYGKAHIAAAWRSQNPHARVLLLGDTEHDMEAAEAMQADCVLISQGHRPLSALLSCGALAVFPNHEALLNALPTLLP